MGDMMHLFVLKDAGRRNKCVDFLNSINLSKPWSVEIKLYEPKRSTAQNRLYWAYINAIAMALEFEPDTLHWSFKKNFIGFEVQEVLGEKIIVPKSTTKLKVADFADYLRKIEIFAGEKGLALPNSDERSYALMGEAK